MAVVFAVSLLTIGLSYAASGKAVTYKGWVVDQLCASKGTAFDGIDLKTSPQNHSVGCALMPPCITSGYGIYVDKGDGSFDFYKLDKKGSCSARGHRYAQGRHDSGQDAEGNLNCEGIGNDTSIELLPSGGAFLHRRGYCL